MLAQPLRVFNFEKASMAQRQIIDGTNPQSLPDMWRALGAEWTICKLPPPSQPAP